MQAIQLDIKDVRSAIHPSSDAVGTAVDELIALIMRDFVESWHASLLSGSPPQAPATHDQTHSTYFPAIVECTIRDALASVIQLGSAIDMPEMGVCRLLPLVTTHLKLFEAAEVEWRGSGSAAVIAGGEEDDIFMAAVYNGGHLHPAVGNVASPDTKITELEHLRKIASRFVEHVVPEREARSKGVRIVVRELIASTILKQVIDALSDPDTLNALLEEKATEALQEQKLVNRLREALDKQGLDGDETRSVPDIRGTASPSETTPRRRKEDSKFSAASYDTFMDDISNTKSILDARRTKNSLLQQIRKTKNSIAAGEGSDKSSKQMRIYLDRLHAALEAIDRRMSQMGTLPVLEHKDTLLSDSLTDLTDTISLRDVLMSPTAVSHLLEFTERRKRSVFVQFWLSVNTFKNPLENAESDSEDESLKDVRPTLQHHSASSLQLAGEEEMKTLKEDLLFYVNGYYRSDRVLSVVNQKYVDTAKRFVWSCTEAPSRTTQREVKMARRSVLHAQRQIYDEMEEEDWPAFQGSQAWHRTLEDLQRESVYKVAVKNTVVPSSSFLESDFFEKDRLVRPVANRAASHAHLFGANLSPLGRANISATGLFGEEAGWADPGGLKSPGVRSKTSLDQLMGGMGGTFDGLKGRMPLFREALFEDEDAQMDDEEGRQEESGGMAQKETATKGSVVRVEKVDAIENILASIIQEDLPLDRGGERRPSFRRQTTSNKVIFSSKLPVKDGEAEDDAAITAAPKASPLFKSEANDTQELKKNRSPSTQIDLAQIERSIERLDKQDELLSSLIRKAELTGSSGKEMRLLEKSKTTIARELRELRFEGSAISAMKSKEDSRVDSILGRLRVQIPHANLNQNSDGKEYATYLIQVSNVASNVAAPDEERGGLSAGSGWVVSRRYNEFYALHNRLRDRFHQVRSLDHVFPGKRLAGLVNAAFIESRRTSLQRYLQEIVKWEAVCRSQEMKNFLSQSIHMFSVEAVDDVGVDDQDFSLNVVANSTLVSKLYRGVTGVAEGLDEILFGPSMFEIIVNRLSNGVVDLVGFHEMEKILAGATTSSAAEIREATQVTNTLFIGSICDAVIELFQLKLDGNWFRRQAIIVVAQQALGGTIERKVRQAIGATLEPNALLGHIAMVKSVLWPNGRLLKQPQAKRSVEEKKMRRENALKKLSTLIPSVASNLIGRDNARRAARRSWAVLQNKRLNKHIIYTILDQVLDDMFTHGEASQNSID
ncbi:hypothetical protein CBS101457_001458 [Exobasidium rhododendri]|nr:hypothetical protein CBS101457_001458 [Exobasidium rhododendri]